jgi:hypothetical protein
LHRPRYRRTRFYRHRLHRPRYRVW